MTNPNLWFNDAIDEETGLFCSTGHGPKSSPFNENVVVQKTTGAFPLCGTLKLLPKSCFLSLVLVVK